MMCSIESIHDESRKLHGMILVLLIDPFKRKNRILIHQAINTQYPISKQWAVHINPEI